MTRTNLSRFAFRLCLATALAGCGASHTEMTPPGIQPSAMMPAGTAPVRATGSGKIQHVIVIVQEARSFDNLFCNYPGSDAARCSSPSQIPLEAKCSISDSFEDFKRDRTTGGFSHEKTTCPGYARPEYQTVPVRETQPYRTIAKRYVLGDRMFSSTGNPTFESHQYHIAAQAADTLDQPFGSAPPDGCVYLAQVRQFSGPPQPACETYKTLADELSVAGLSWRYYAAGASEPTWDAFGWVRGNPAGTAPPTQFFSDLANGHLGAVTWVTPELRDSDLSGSQSATGPAWVASLVNAIGESTFWNTTAIFITWSGFGGWADHVSPPQIDRDGLGFRVPLLMVSPYAKQGYVTHVSLETGSILHFAEDQFGLNRLAASDMRANSPIDGFDFSQQPRSFVPLPTR
jgi:phospholipase C